MRRGGVGSEQVGAGFNYLEAKAGRLGPSESASTALAADWPGLRTDVTASLG